MNSYSFNQVSDKYPALGIVTSISLLAVTVLLQYTQKLIRVDRWLITFNSLKTRPKLLTFLAALYYIAALIPTLLLIVWVVLLLVAFGKSPGLPILFHGLFLNVLILPSKDTLYYYKLLTLTILFVVGQLVTIFTSETWSVQGMVIFRSTGFSYFSISAVLLILNGALVSLSAWIIKGKSWELQDSLPPVKDEFVKWCPTWNSDPHPLILTGGLYATLCNHPKKNWIIAGIYVLSLMCLLALALIVYYATPYGVLGSVTAIAVVTTDAIILLIVNLEEDVFVSPNVVSILVMIIRYFCVLLRVCLFGFTADYWFMGYCLLYLLLMTYIFYLIVDKNYPSFEKIPTMDVKRVNVLKMPEFVGLFGTLLFAAIIFYLGNQKEINIPVTTIKIGTLDYPYWAIGIGSIILAIAWYFYLSSLRLLQRRRNHVREFAGFFLGWSKFSEYYIYAVIAYIMIVIFGCYFFMTVGNPIIWLITVFIPLIYEAFLQFYRSWEENDYLILGNVEKYNLKMKKKVEAQENLKKKQDEIMQKMMTNTKAAAFFKNQKLMEDLNRGTAKITPIEGPPSPLQEDKKKSKENSANGDSKGMIPEETSGVKLVREEEEESQLFDVHRVKVSSYQPVADWRKQSTFWKALIGGHLLPTDKRILISVPVIIGLMLIFSLICLFAYKETMAFTISAEMLFLFLTVLPMRRYFSTLQKPEIFEIVMFCIGIILNFVFGGIGLINGWRSQVVWIIWWGFANPLFLCFYALWGLIRDYGITLFSLVTSVVTVLIGIGMGVFVLVAFNLAAGLGVIGASLYFAYFLGIGLYYIKNNYSLPRIVLIITAALIVLTAVGVMIAAFALPDFDDFLGFSITYLVLNFMLLGFASYRLLDDIWTRVDSPNFFSPYGVPIYKYRGELDSCQSNRLPAVLFVFGLFLLLNYCQLVQIFVSPSNLGVSLSCLFELLIFLTSMYFLTYNSYQAGMMSDKITPQIVLESWNIQKQVQAKLKQVSSETEGSLMTQMKQQLDSLEKKYNVEANEDAKAELLMQVSDLEYKLEREVNEQLLVGVNLWVRCLSRVQGLERKYMLKLVNFVSTSGDILASMGIGIVVDSVLDLQSKFRQIKSDYNLLAPEQKIKFDFAYSEWQKERAKNDQLVEQREKQQEEQKQKREAELLKKLEQQQNNKQDDSNLPLDKMRDSPAKLKKMLDVFKTGNPFVDTSFKFDKSMLPSDAQRMLKNLIRPTPDCFLIDDSDTAFDVRQGAIGNCYMISSIGILNRKYIDKLLGIGEWQNPYGAYMVRFKKLGRDIYVIVDDFFPIGMDNSWLLGRSQTEKELYINVVEKAFAKLYGGYDKIVGGKVNITLSELTGGFPEQIKLVKYQQSGTNDLFDKMLSYFQMGYLMGAGSPENVQGDAAIQQGIVQSHAYQIIRVSNLDGYRLIKLRNPHGSEGAEWTGDWSDKSQKWTQRLLELVKQSLKQDGAFWMSIDDFVYCYKSLYICRIFEPTTWRSVRKQGKWQGQKAAGLPSPKNPGAMINKNPHYGIRVYKKSTLFIELQQNEKEGSWKGKNFIYYMVQRNAGKRMKNISVDKLCGKSDTATNTSTISGQIELEATAFPYVFSLVVACINAGDTGSFNLTIYCNDMDMEVIDDSEFDV